MSKLQSRSNVLKMLRRRALLIVAVVAAGVSLSLAYAMSRPAIYEATAVIQIETPQIAADLTRPSASVNSNENRIKLIEQKLMSRDSIVAVIEKFDLFSEDPTLSLAQKVGMLRQSARIVELIDPAQSWRPDVHPSGLIITVQMGDARQAADVANEFLSLVLVEGKERREGRATRTLGFFKAEEARVGAEIETLEQEFARFKEAHSASLPDGVTAQRDQLARLKESLLEVEGRIIQLETNRDRLRADEQTRQTELLRQQLMLVQDRITEIETALNAAPEVERQFSAMSRKLDQLQDEFRVITTRRTEAAMAQQLESQNQFERFEVLETALVPEYPVSAGKRKIAIAGAIASIFAGFGLAFGLEMVSPVMRTSAQMERELDLRPVVIIPNLRKSRTTRLRRLGWAALALLVPLGIVALLRDRLGAILEGLNVFNRRPDMG
ncbi:Wzz/FepE/Etk N-terminal domain-containing protein [Thalassovita taeanensis]|uniref:Uncharacterized protein involved in exopolysaccharide biosynthesis n=1 Tax=Thalassovita taeanensis TaxID=657014 RepID=A0A1H9C1J8_9RHOB|nr:Wzz/FepE/Etk N-terminal domain-containing protein [Thalassovita taeanensis]SEP95059.1 Uncharacterized protein involved in exopolysaccharide biosynthesis [Thalassovita taeanensis]